MMVTPRPAMLFLCQTLPFPPDGGVNIRTYNILKLLAAEYDIDAVFFYRRGVAQSVARGIEGLTPLVRSIEAFPILQEHSRLRFLQDHLASSLTRAVYTRHVYDNDAARTRIRDLVQRHDYAVVHCDSLDLSAYLPDVQSLPVVCVHHNVESRLLARRAARESNALRRKYLEFQARLMEREEATWCPRVALNAVCSPDDGEALLEIAPQANVAVVPNGVDVATFQPATDPAGGVVFVGGMTWFPNRDGLDFFADDILPALKRRGATPVVTWVGRAFPGAAERYATQGITLTGYVDDVQPYVHAARCFIVPLRVGGGTRLKVLDAWAMGKAVVSTSVGCEGLDARDGWNILVRDDPESFAEAIEQVLTNDELRRTLGENARQTVESTYSWERIGVSMLEEYRAIDGASRALR